MSAPVQTESDEARDAATTRLELRRTLARVRARSQAPDEDSKLFKLQAKATRMAQDADRRRAWLEEDEGPPT